MQHATGSTEKDRMTREADFAFRQAWALCPDSTEAVFRYVALLLEQKRVADALLVAETAAQMPSMHGQEGEQIRALVAHLKQLLKAKSASSGGK
jgi:thioredoxin-like negative regulator of GroEL